MGLDEFRDTGCQNDIQALKGSGRPLPYWHEKWELAGVRLFGLYNLIRRNELLSVCLVPPLALHLLSCYTLFRPRPWAEKRT